LEGAIRRTLSSGAAVAAIVSLLAAGCAADATMSPGPPSGAASAKPTATVSMSIEPAPAATPVATPTRRPDGLTADSFAEVATNDLRVRSRPRVSDDSIKLEPLLWKDALLFVIDGPVAASGYDWFLVRPMGEADLQVHPDPPRLGWVAAASRDGEPWIKAHSFPCGGATPFGMLSEFDYPPHGLIGLACFGDSPMRFDADLVSGLVECDPPSILEPSWLDPCRDGLALADPARLQEDPRRLHVAFDPGVDVNALPEGGSGVAAAVTVTGRFDHEAARTCRLDAGPSTGPDARPPELVVLGCRAQFVVTSISLR
jgi:hypothetical protein